MNRREDEDEIWGLAHNVEAQNRMTLSSLTIRERSTLFGMLRLWPQCERRRISGPWDGTERRAWHKSA